MNRFLVVSVITCFLHYGALFPLSGKTLGLSRFRKSHVNANIKYIHCCGISEDLITIVQLHFPDISERHLT